MVAGWLQKCSLFVKKMVDLVLQFAFRFVFLLVLLFVLWFELRFEFLYSILRSGFGRVCVCIFVELMFAILAITATIAITAITAITVIITITAIIVIIAITAITASPSLTRLRFSFVRVACVRLCVAIRGSLCWTTCFRRSLVQSLLHFELSLHSHACQW